MSGKTNIPSTQASPREITLSSIPDGETVELAIDNGEPGKNRIDAVVAAFTRGGGDVADTHSFAVVKGTAVSGTASPPSLTASGLASAGDVNQLALFYVYITATQITEIRRVASLLPSAGSGRGIFVQQSQPSSPSAGDIWMW